MDIIKLRELLESELSNEELVPLDEEFYKEIRGLLKAIKLSAERSRERGENVDEQIYLEELKIAKGLVMEILRLRLHKLVDMAYSGTISELVEEEKKAFMFLKSFFELSRVNMLSVKVELPLPSETEEEQKESITQNLYIVHVDLPVILDPYMREYGPIKKGDLLTLTPEIGEVLVERGLATRIILNL